MTRLPSLSIETLGDAVIAVALIMCFLAILPVEWAVSGGAKAVAVGPQVTLSAGRE